ncbi:MAG: hypothetical protein PHS62_05355 [Patescibacteria group bacterium]|nr:hypothetical protein [Patescibacteria group bacterium]
MKNIEKLLVTAVISLLLVLFGVTTAVYAEAPSSSNTDNVAAAAPSPSDTGDTTPVAPSSSNTDNTMPNMTPAAPSSSNTDNATVSTAPSSSNTDNTMPNVTPAAPSSSNTDNATSNPTPSTANTDNTTTPATPAAPTETPASSGPSYSGGGAIILSTSPCASVVYGEWGAPVSGIQYRNVLSQNPQSCSLTADQQNARSRVYQAAVAGVKYYADGSLLRGTDWKIYLIINGQKKLIKNWTELQEYRGKTIFNVNNDVIAQYPDYTGVVAGVKAYANGSLLRVADHRIYLIINGKRQYIKSLQELKKYAGKTVYNVSYETLYQYQDVK